MQHWKKNITVNDNQWKISIKQNLKGKTRHSKTKKKIRLKVKGGWVLNANDDTAKLTNSGNGCIEIFQIEFQN